MDRKKRVVCRPISLLLSLLLAMNCLGPAGIAFAKEEANESLEAFSALAEETAIPENPDGEAGETACMESSQDAAEEEAAVRAGQEIAALSWPEEDAGPSPAETVVPGEVVSNNSEQSAPLNTEPIVGSSENDGVAVQVSAPVGSFSDGTTLSIHAVAKEGAAVGFDITFVDASGSVVQPKAGVDVSLSFSIDGNSGLLSDVTGETMLSVYHKCDDGTIDTLKSAVSDGEPVCIEVAASHFSEYGVMAEPVSAGDGKAAAPEVRGQRSATSADLGDFLVEAIINAPVDENGAYIINPNSSYEMTLSFAENEEIQFDDKETLVYNLPGGIIVGDVGPTAFSITVVDENGTAAVEGNTFEVVDGQLLVRFNQEDPNFARLGAMPNVSFGIGISSRFDQSFGEIVFNADVIKDFVYEEKSDIAIYKSVRYDMESDTAYYELQILSDGLNENVVIEDRLTGTALIFNQDVVVESSVNGTLSATPDYASVDNGFRVTIPQTVDGEAITLRYSATVDNTKISANGTVEQTNNTARVTSEQVPNGKEASADFAGQAKFQRVSKTAAGDPTPVGDGLYEQTWSILVNEDHKLPMGGTYIYDWIAQNSRPFMQFTGEGIAVNVTFEDGSAETRTVPWSDLYLYSNSTGTYGWRYLAPETDGKASYEITCTTLIDTSGALGDLTLVNGAQINNSYDEGTTTVGVIGENVFNIQKDAVGTTDTESEWKITVTVPGSGLSEMHVTDDAPKLTYEEQDYIDYFQEGSFEIEGLLEGESWKLYIGSSQRSYTITFYQSETQSDANKGLLPTPDGQPRDIVIHFKTNVNQDWLNLAAEDGYSSSTLYRHRNYAAAWSGSYRTPTVDATVIPIRPDLVKSFVERADVEIDGATFPVFRYYLALFGPVEDGITIQDSFSTDYLKLYDAAGIRILGGNNSNPTDGNGTISAVDTAEGMDITVSSFPKQSDGSFYPYYQVSYSLIAKDLDALNALNATAAESQNGIDLENTASWEGRESSRVVNYTYFPYVDKELLTRPTADNGYVAEFQIVINQYAEDLNPTSDVLAVQDVLSPNLRFIPDSLSISPSNDSIVVQHDDETNTLTFTEVPDETTFVITYQARVLGSGNVAYSNTIKFGTFEKTVEETAVVESSGGGTASNPSITLVKRDSEDLSTTLSGATFQLFYIMDGGQVPVVDGSGRNVTFTTGDDGKVLIVGNLQSLGWALWAERTYCLVEVEAPSGYELNSEPSYFVLTTSPSSQIEFDITGDQLSVNDEAVKVSVPVTKSWVGPVGAEGVIVHLLANEVDTGKTITLNEAGGWTGAFNNLRKYDGAGSEISYSVKEEPLAGYMAQYDAAEGGGWIITNTSTATIDIPVSKSWVGPAAGPVTVMLRADGAEAAALELSEGNGWAGTFEGLPVYDPSDGHEIAYDVEEQPGEGYSSERAGSVAEGFAFTNVNTEKITVEGHKTWDDSNNQDGIRPSSITIRLAADGTEVESLTVSAADGWSWSFEDLPRYDYTDGHEISYAIIEDAVDGYTASYDGFSVTNRHVPAKTTVSVSKAWSDHNDKEGVRPKSVTFRLLANGVDTGKAISITASEGWAGAFSDLDEYEAGRKIVYTIVEDSVDGYTASISGDAESGFVVTNSHEPEMMPGTTTVPTSKSSMPKTGDSLMAVVCLLAALAIASLLLMMAASTRRNRDDTYDDV